MSQPVFVESVSDVWFELFNHHEFLQSEIHNFINEFETKRGDTEVEKLLASLEIVTDLKDIQIQRFILSANNHLPSIQINLPKALTLTENILQFESEISTVSSLEVNLHFKQNEAENCKIRFESRAMQQTLNDTKIKIIPSEPLITLIKTFNSEDEVTQGLHRINKKCKLVSGNTQFSGENRSTSEENLETIKSLQKQFQDISLQSKQQLRFHFDQDIDNSIDYLTLTDLRCLKHILNKHKINDRYLHELLCDCEIYLPKNDVIRRNSQLEKRCVELRARQKNLEYRAMTKNVDSFRAKLPEDTISYQLREINKQLIAIAQFIMSVLAGFAFGFLGVELLVGHLDFGFRLLLGIICALIIALAEIYFLAKKLNEYSDFLDKSKEENQKTFKVPGKQKMHQD